MSERSEKTLGGYCGGVPPLPIPNREVKPACADGTAMQCGRVGGCLLYLRSSESNDFGDLFFVPIGGYGILQGVHLSPLGFAACQSKKCTNRSLVGAAETAAPPDPGRYFQILVDTNCIFQPLITSKPIGCAAAGRYGRCFHLLYFSADSHISKT